MKERTAKTFFCFLSIADPPSSSTPSAAFAFFVKASSAPYIQASYPQAAYPVIYAQTLSFFSIPFISVAFLLF